MEIEEINGQVQGEENRRVNSTRLQNENGDDGSSIMQDGKEH